MTIYLVEYTDYDGGDAVGYFTDSEKAKSCCEYLNRTRHSEYEEFDWYVSEYNLDETDYKSLNKELDEQERLEFENRLEKEKQEAIAEITRLKEKYGIKSWILFYEVIYVF